jgi:outer membrane protein OmpA-like peptidoglycan-associated protein
VNDKGEIIRTVMTNNSGSFEFQKLTYDEDFTILINEEDLLASYYGNNPSNDEKSIISKGNLQWVNVRNDQSVIATEPADSLEVLLVGQNYSIVNASSSDIKGDWLIDNLPSTPITDNRTFPYNLEMENEDLIYKDLLNEVDTLENPLYTIIRDIIPLPEDAIIEKPSIAFEPIYFDFDKFFLRLKSEEVLNKILDYMKDNPEVSIEIMGHTDWFGSDDYNMKLSKRRSKSAFDYLVKKGIGEERLVMKWYGESQPAVPNENADGSDNEDNRQLNRRCEFKITNGLTAYSVFLY